MLYSIYATNMSRTPEEPLDNRIEEVRNSLNLSRTQLAEMVGVHYQTIGYLERGEYSPSLALALKLSRALATPVEELFSPVTKEHDNG